MGASGPCPSATCVGARKNTRLLLKAHSASAT
jgi:hypothetical protein